MLTLPFLISICILIVLTIDLLLIYILLECLSTIIIIISLINSSNKKIAESLVIYFVLNIIVSAFLLCGLLLIYFLFQSFNIVKLSELFKLICITKTQSLNYLLNIKICIFFYYTGFIFKLGLFPLHFYVPYLYESSHPGSINLLSTVIKSVCFFVLAKINFFLFFQLNIKIINDLLVFLGILSMIIGTLSAYSTKYIKKFIGYSSISHFGFLLIGIGINS